MISLPPPPPSSLQHILVVERRWLQMPQPVGLLAWLELVYRCTFLHPSPPSLQTSPTPCKGEVGTITTCCNMYITPPPTPPISHQWMILHYTDILTLNPPPPLLHFFPQQVFVLELAIRNCPPPPSYVSKVSLWNMKNLHQSTTHSN